MLERKFRGPWEKVYREAGQHGYEFAGHDVEMTVLDQSIQENGETLAEGLKDYIGIISSESGDWSQNTGEKFRNYLEEKRHKENL